MKFVHVADLHLGKVIYQQNLLPLQVELLEQIIQYMDTNNVPVLVIAGDVYDRSIPSSEAVRVLSTFLRRLILEYHKKVLIISGNHDSSERLQFASELLQENGLYIVSYPQKEMQPIVIDDVHFYLIPFFKPSYIRYLLGVDCHTYQEAFAAYLQHQNIDYTKTNVLVTHHFVAGNKEPATSDSEVILSVGGSEIIDVTLMENFDYVALGHLHASQKIKKETIRYSGSLMKYSFDEVHQKKGIVAVDIKNKQVTCEVVPLSPSKDLKLYEGSYASFLQEDMIRDKDDLISFALDDKQVIPNAIDQLRQIYPNVLQITYPNLYGTPKNTITKASTTFENLDMKAKYAEFYQNMTGEAISDDLETVLQEIIGGMQNVT